MAWTTPKTFSAGERLFASDLNTYVSDNLADLDPRTVKSFADASARSTAIPSPAAGALTFLEDTDAVEVYDGSAWVSVAPTPTPPAIIQTVSAVKTDQFSMTGTTPTLVTGLSVNITPTKASSNILIICGFNLGNDNGSGQAAARLERSSTAITERNVGIVGDFNRFQTLTVLDNPGTTSSTNYNLKVWSPDNTGTVYINESGTVQRSTLFVAEID